MDNNNEMDVDSLENPYNCIGNLSTCGNEKTNVYLPGQKECQKLVYDESAYIMFHQGHTGSPCLSFDIIQNNDSLFEEFPLSSYVIFGTQATKAHVNNIILMKMYNLYRTSSVNSEDCDELNVDENSVGTDEKQPKMSSAWIKHQGCVNRIRTTKLGNSFVAASWSELGRVNVWNLNDLLQAVEDDSLLNKFNKDQDIESMKPVFTFSGHQNEGFAIDWNAFSEGLLATGDCRRDIYIWQPVESGTWKIDQRPLIGHKNSVEDIQWSPNERSVMASCSVDKSIRIWDVRASPQQACMLKTENAHESDVNVISWNKNDPFIVSGGDDGFLHVWDLRQFQREKPIATFKHHTNHITTVEWHPTDSSVFASGGADDQIALWDLAIEKDEEEYESHIVNQEELKNLPPQLLFIHQGQEDIKELHWHPQLHGVIISTANSGFNIFKTISV